MNKNLLAIAAIVISAAFIRIIPHAPNFSPLGAMALFAGAYITNRWLAFGLPLVTLLISDALMGFNGWVYPEQIAFVYGTFLLIALLGKTLLNRKNMLRVGLGSVASSVLFFAITNFGVWAGGFIHQPALYPLNAAGLIESYIAAIPFFHNTLFSDLFYNALFFGSFYLLQINIPALAKQKA
jgi:hypothetical protein